MQQTNIYGSGRNVRVLVRALGWKQDGGNFVQFGQDGTESLFCLWFYPSIEGEPPVVFFGSEGERFLVSDSSSDFVALLTSGLMFFDGEWLEPSVEDKKSIHWSVLKELGLNHTGVQLVDPAKFLALAKARHPSFSDWVNKHTR